MKTIKCKKCKMKFKSKLILLVKCPACQNKTHAKDTMQDTLCNSCKEKKDNVGKYAGFKDDKGHSLVFQRYLGEKYEPHCKICRCFIIPTKRLTAQPNLSNVRGK